LDNFDNAGRKVCCKVSLYKNSQRQSCTAINCLSSGVNILAGRRPLLPEILAPSDLTPPEISEFSHILPCSASTVRDRKRSSITKNSTRALQRAINQVFYAAPNFLIMGIKYLNLSSFGRLRQYKAKCLLHSSLYKYCQRQSCSAINCLSSGIKILAVGSSVSLISERKGTDPHWKHLRCTHFAS